MTDIVRFEKIVPEGKALGHLDGKVIFCQGILPNELAEVEITRDKKSYAEARLLKLLEPSLKRDETAEDHALICSPWQGVNYGYQLDIKAKMLCEAFDQQHLTVTKPTIVPSEQQLEFRNRLDFMLTKSNDRTSLAFHMRDSFSQLSTLPVGCKLGSATMNQAALAICSRLDELEVTAAQSLTVRQSLATGNVLVWVGVGKKEAVDYAKLKSPSISSLVVALPSSGSNPSGKLILSIGPTQLTEKLTDLSIAYPFDGFFQTNIPAFRTALDDIIRAVPNNALVADLYAGAGSIGLSVAGEAKRVVAVEVGGSSTEYAAMNAESLQIDNYEIHTSLAENVDQTFLSAADCVIADPPRAGFHPKLVSKLLEAIPRRIIYLSCNPVTQARDIAGLASKYKIDSLTAYDFYPGTPHLESLAVLQLR